MNKEKLRRMCLGFSVALLAISLCACGNQASSALEVCGPTQALGQVTSGEENRLSVSLLGVQKTENGSYLANLVNGQALTSAAIVNVPEGTKAGTILVSQTFTPLECMGPDWRKLDKKILNLDPVVISFSSLSSEQKGKETEIINQTTPTIMAKPDQQKNAYPILTPAPILPTRQKSDNNTIPLQKATVKETPQKTGNAQGVIDKGWDAITTETVDLYDGSLCPTGPGVLIEREKDASWRKFPNVRFVGKNASGVRIYEIQKNTDMPLTKQTIYRFLEDTRPKNPQIPPLVVITEVDNHANWVYGCEKVNGQFEWRQQGYLDKEYRVTGDIENGYQKTETDPWN